MQGFTKKIQDAIKTGIIFFSSLDLKQRLIGGAYISFALALIFALAVSNGNISNRKLYYPPDNYNSNIDAADFTIGLDIQRINDINLESRSFSAEGWVSLKWKDLPDWVKSWDPKIHADPVLTLSLANAINRDDLHLKATPSPPYLDTDGNYIQWLEFSGSFYIDKINLRKFPFHTIELPIEIEFDDYFAEEVNVRIREMKSRLIGVKEFSGYSFESENIVHSTKIYQTNFGMAGESSKDNPESLYDNLRYSLVLKKNGFSSFFLVFMPLLMSMTITFVTPLISPRHYDTKVALPASVLLVLVFLQQGYQSMMPKHLGYTTFADFAYNLSMSVTILTFLWSLHESNQVLESQINNKMLKTFRKYNQYFCIANAIYFACVLTAGWAIVN